MDTLGSRMKEFYEDRYRIKLPRRTNIICRIDGKAFHSYTKNCTKPFDDNLINDMNEMAIYLCENMPGSKLAYVQSDECSIVINDYNNIKTDAWFDNNLQKMCSVSASLATAKFNQIRYERHLNENKDKEKFKLATFDSRFFVIPEPIDVYNYFYWRELDCIRNSIQMVGQANFSAKQLHRKNCDHIKKMLLDNGVDWNNLPVSYQRGRTITKSKIEVPIKNFDFSNITESSIESKNKGIVVRSKWMVDNNIPIFSENPNYILDKLSRE